MIRLTENISARLMLIHGYTMLALGLALFFIRATMTNLFFMSSAALLRCCWWRALFCLSPA